MDLNGSTNQLDFQKNSLLSDKQKEIIKEFFLFKLDIPNRIAMRKRMAKSLVNLKMSDSSYMLGNQKEVESILTKKKAGMIKKVENFNDIYLELNKLSSKLRKSLEKVLYSAEIDKIINCKQTQIRDICESLNINLF